MYTIYNVNNIMQQPYLVFLYNRANKSPKVVCCFQLYWMRNTCIIFLHINYLSIYSCVGCIQNFQRSQSRSNDGNTEDFSRVPRDPSTMITGHYRDWILKVNVVHHYIHSDENIYIILFFDSEERPENYLNSTNYVYEIFGYYS